MKNKNTHLDTDIYEIKGHGTRKEVTERTTNHREDGLVVTRIMSILISPIWIISYLHCFDCI